VTGDNFMAVMETTALRHVSVGTVFRSDGETNHFTSCVGVFLYREFPDR